MSCHRQLQGWTDSGTSFTASCAPAAHPQWLKRRKKNSLKIADDAAPLPLAPKGRKILKFPDPLDRISGGRRKQVRTWIDWWQKRPQTREEVGGVIMIHFKQLTFTKLTVTQLRFVSFVAEIETSAMSLPVVALVVRCEQWPARRRERGPPLVCPPGRTDGRREWNEGEEEKTFSSGLSSGTESHLGKWPSA